MQGRRYLSRAKLTMLDRHPREPTLAPGIYRVSAVILRASDSKWNCSPVICSGIRMHLSDLLFRQLSEPSRKKNRLTEWTTKVGTHLDRPNFRFFWISGNSMIIGVVFPYENKLPWLARVEKLGFATSHYSDVRGNLSSFTFAKFWAQRFSYSTVAQPPIIFPAWGYNLDPRSEILGSPPTKCVRALYPCICWVP